MEIQIPKLWSQKDLLLWSCFYLHDDSGDNPSEHKHSGFYELVLVVQGDGIHSWEGMEEVIGVGNVFVIAPGERHYYKTAHNLGIYNIVFEEAIFEFVKHYFASMSGFQMLFRSQKSEVQKSRVIFQMPVDGWQELVNEAALIANIFGERNAGFKILMLGSFFKLIYYVCKNCKSSLENDYMINNKISHVIKIMQSKFDSRLTLNDLAAYAGMSVSNFRKHFRTLLGISPIEYLLRLKLERARELLVTTNDNIDAVAYSTGFEYGNYFARQFKKHYGLQPGEYRKLFAVQTSAKQLEIIERNGKELNWVKFQKMGFE